MKQLLKLSEFCGIEILGYCIMSNHYHVLIRVPAFIDLTDEALLEKVKTFYGADSQQFRSFERKMKVSDVLADNFKKMYLGMMGDMSVHQKLLKQRFSKWYNKRNRRKGTLWMERYNSVVLEDTFHARMTVNAYMNLNPVRAGMINDPAEYRFSDYGQAMGGNKVAREGLMKLSEEGTWSSVQRVYRPFILARGLLDSKSNGRTIKESLLKEAEDRNGKLPLSKLLRLRVRYFSDGVVLGGEEFVEKIYQDYREYFGRSRRKGSRKMSGGDWGNLTVIRDLRNDIFS